MPNGVPRRRQNHYTAVAKQIIVTVQFQVIKFPSVHQIRHYKASGTGPALELLRPPALVKLFLLHHMDGIWEHRDVADVVKVSMRGHNDFDFVSGIAELLQLHVDDVSPFLAGFQEIAIAWRPIRLAVISAIRYCNVVAGIKYHQAFRVVENPHADRDGNLTRF